MLIYHFQVVQLYYEAGQAIGAMPLLLLQPVWVCITVNLDTQKIAVILKFEHFGLTTE